MERVYFDNASTTPVDPAVVDAMRPYFSAEFGNAASPHAYGQAAHKALEDARVSVARSIGAESHEVVFNSGATEGNNHAIFGIARAHRNRGNHILVSAIEHRSVLEAVDYLKNHEGFQVTYIPVDQGGLIDPDIVASSISDRTILIAMMYANNEIGVIQPVSKIGQIARERQIPFLVDAVQVIGHLPVDVKAINADLLTLSAHKCYGPKGVGILYIRKGVEIGRFLMGGSQENGRRASTQNVAGAVGMAKAVEIAVSRINEETQHQLFLRDKLFKGITRKIEGVQVNGSRIQRLPNNVHCSFEGVQGESLLMSLDMAGIAASMGSACSAGSLDPSHVLKAIGLDDHLAMGALRITLGRGTTEEHVDYLLDKLPDIINSLRV